MAARENLPQKFWPPEIPNWNFRPEIPAPLQRVAPQLVKRDLAEFSRAGNYEISGPRKFCQTRISGPFTERCTTTFCKGLSQISKGQKFSPRKFCPGVEIPALGRKFRPWSKISGPGNFLLWVISSLSTVVPFPTSLHLQSCAIPG
jgi:hypothetical protein